MTKRRIKPDLWKDGDRVEFVTFDHELTYYSELDGSRGTIVGDAADMFQDVYVFSDYYGDEIVADPFSLIPA